MKSKEVSPRLVMVVVLATLAAVLYFYWRGLLPQPGDGDGGMMGGGGGMPPPAPMGEPAVQVSTLAGRPMPGYADGPSRSARFNGPAGVAVGPAGSVYVSDSRNHRIRRVGPGGDVSTAAGSGPVDVMEGGHRDGPAAEALFCSPAGLALSPGGTLFIADAGNHCIRALRPDGRVTTIAGRPGPPDAAGLPSGAYADGPASTARFSFPTAVALDPSGNLYVADTGNDCIRRIAPDGVVATLAGRPGAACVDGPGTSARFRSPTGIAWAASAGLYVADTGNRCIRVVSADGTTRTLPTPRLEPPPSAGEWTPHPRPGLNPAPAGPRLLQPAGIAQDARGELLVADVAVDALYQAAPADGSLYLLAGIHCESGGAGWSDGRGDRARFARPSAIARAPDGAIYVADFGNNCVRRVVLPLEGPKRGSTHRESHEGLRGADRGPRRRHPDARQRRFRPAGS